jgi:hypothetical protein
MERRREGAAPPAWGAPTGNPREVDSPQWGGGGRGGRGVLAGESGGRRGVEQSMGRSDRLRRVAWGVTLNSPSCPAHAEGPVEVEAE